MVPVIETQTASAPAGGVLKHRALEALAKLPPFSPILNKLMASLAGEDVSFIKLGDLIEKDTVIAGNVLHLVNSALYGRSGEVTSVRHALSILGIDKTRNAILGMSLSRMWNQVRTPAGWSMARFNKHSASVAILSDLMAQQLPVEYPEGAFVAGLFHDIGRLLIALGLPAEFERVLDRYHHTDHPWVACEQEVLGFTHAELSADALAVWELPEPIQRAARDHHAQVPFQLGATHPCATPGATRLGVTHSAATIPLSRVLDAANRYANSMGDAIILHQKNDASGAAWIESFGLAHEVVDRLVADYDAEHKAMAQFFS